MNRGLTATVAGMLLLATPCFCELYITVTSSGVKKARLAVGQLKPLTDMRQPDPALAQRVRDKLLADLEFTNLFEFISDALVSPLERSATEAAPLKFEDWAAVSASFVLKIGYRINDGTLAVEAVLYDVASQKKILGTRYQHPAQQYVRLVHTLAEDILKALTGETGLFNSRIAMVCWDRKKGMAAKEIFLVSPDGSDLIRLTSDKTLSLSPAWSPDGKFLAYTQFEWLSSHGVRKKGMVLKKHQLATGERTALSRKDGVNSGAAWAPSGSRILATLSFSGRPELYFLNPAGESEPEPLSRNVQWTSFGGIQKSNPDLLFEVEATYSPDGSKIAMSSRRTGNPMIYTVDLATRVATQLTFAGKYNATPAWSPKGDKIVFAAQRTGEGNFDLYAIDPDGNNLARITNGERPGHRVNSENPSWAPTGRHLAFASNDGGAYGVYVMSLDGGTRTRVSPAEKECKSPAWSPPE